MKVNGEKKTFPFPDVIINAANQKTNEQKRIYYKLEEIIPFTSYPVGSKPFVFSKMKQSNYLKQFLIPYIEINNRNDILTFLKQHQQIILKPVRGHHGDNVIKIKEHKDKFIITKKQYEHELNSNEFLHFLDKLPNEMIAQKFIDSSISTGEPFDYRMHLQKNIHGLWVITIIIPRVGSKSRVVTNISQGSTMMEFLKFLRNEYREHAREIKRQIESFALKFAYEFERQYPYNFDELGIDIGYDHDGNIWVYEVNWRPGHIFIEVPTARNTIHYAIFLAKQRRRKDEETKSQ